MAVVENHLFDPEPYRLGMGAALVHRLEDIRAYRDYLESPHWQAFKEWALLARGRRCEMCGRSDQVDVHHLSYLRRGHERLDDVQVLCRDHHRQAHAVAVRRRREERNIGVEKMAA